VLDAFQPQLREAENKQSRRPSPSQHP